MKLRVVESQWEPFINGLRKRRDVETAGIILAEKVDGGEVLLARHLIEMPEYAYLVRRRDQIRLDPVAVNRAIRPARDGGLSIITIHTHPGAELPWFSDADDRGDSRLIPSFHHQMPGPHGSMVVAGNSGVTIGRVWTDAGEKLNLDLCEVGRRLKVSTSLGLQTLESSWFDRQRLALGREGQEALRSLHVAVIGLGGTGSVCFLQLVHLGVGRITIVDGDYVDASNVSRILGSTAGDAGKTLKVDVAERYAAQVGFGTQIRCLNGHLGAEVSPEEIAECDVVLSCVDRHLPRALLNRLAYCFAVPVIDMGSAFRVGVQDEITAGAGRVVLAGPGRPCLACWGHIDPNRIRIESLSEADRASEIADGYISGAAVAQPSVVAFNTVVAGTALVELMRLVTGFAGADDPPLRLSFDFTKGTVRRNTLPAGTGCRICLPKAPSGDTLDKSSDDSATDLGILADEVTS